MQCSSDALLTMRCLPRAAYLPATAICCRAHAQVSLEFCSYPPSYRHPKVPEGLQYYTLQAQLSGETGALPPFRSYMAPLQLMSLLRLQCCVHSGWRLAFMGVSGAFRHPPEPLSCQHSRPVRACPV